MVTVNYVNGFCKGVDLEDLRSLKKVGNSIIMANRLNEELKDVKEKVYTRDLFARD